MIEPSTVVYTCNPNTQEAFEASLGYKVNARPARDTQQDRLKKRNSQVGWNIPIILALGKLSQKDQQLGSSFSRQWVRSRPSLDIHTCF